MDKLSKKILNFMNAQENPAEAVCCLDKTWRSYTTIPLSDLIAAVNRNEAEIRSAVDYLVAKGYAKYFEIQPIKEPVVVGFLLSHEGLHYKEIRFLTNKEKWTERIWSFVSGIATGMLIDYLIYLIR